MNKRRRFKAKRRRLGVMPEAFRRSTFPWWRAKVTPSNRPLTVDLFRQLFERCSR